MYSNRHLRFLVAVLLVIGLIPTVLLGVQTGDSAHHSMLFFAAVRALIIGGVFSIVGTTVVMKAGGAPLEPYGLTSLAVFALYVFCSTVAGFVPVVGFLVLVILGWGLSAWLLELSPLNAVFVGIVFFAGKLIGGLFALGAGMSKALN